MNKMKKIMSALFTGAGLVAPLIASSGVHATDPQITINNGAENLYVASGSQSSTDGTASYNADTNTLTLNGFSGSDIHTSGLAEVVISLKGENTLSMLYNDYFNIRGITADNAKLTITGDGTLEVNQLDLGLNNGSIIKADSVTVDTATLNLNANASKCIETSGDNSAITINSGTLTFSTCDFAMHSENITVNGGVINSDIKLTQTTIIEPKSKNFELNGGQITINTADNVNPAMMFSGNVEINDGSLKTTGGSAGIEIYKGNSGHFTISGGVLEINDSNTGISSGTTFNKSDTGSYLEFIGGTTIINAKQKAAQILYGEENSAKNIVLGEGMLLSPENLSVKMEYKDYSGVWEEYTYYLASNGAPAKSVVITDQESEIPDTDDEEIVVPDTGATEQEETKAKTPKTGLNTDNQNYLAVAIIGLPVLLGTAMGIRYFIRSRKSIKLDY